MRALVPAGAGEAALDKNQALLQAGAVVPRSFAEFGDAIKKVYEGLVTKGTIVPKPEPDIPRVPLDYTWAKRLGMVRKPANFISTISDDRGEELKYAGVPISEVFAENLGVGGVLCLLWFKKRLPAYATKFVEMVLMVTADHGPSSSRCPQHHCCGTSRQGLGVVISVWSVDGRTEIWRRPGRGRSHDDRRVGSGHLSIRFRDRVQEKEQAHYGHWASDKITGEPG